MTEIPADQVKIEVWPIDGIDARGGQHVGTGHRGVRITHLPSATVAISMLARSQHTNRLIAMDMILAAITHPKFR